MCWKPIIDRLTVTYLVTVPHRHQPIGVTLAILLAQAQGEDRPWVWESNWMYNPVLRDSLDSFLSQQKTYVSARKQMDLQVYKLRMDLIYRQMQTSLSPGSCSDKNEVCQSLPEVLLRYSFWWGWSEWVERCFCYIGWSRPGLLICIAELAAMVVQHFWSHDYFFYDCHNSQIAWFKTK